MSRSNMRGSIASFIVVGVALAGLLLGSIYLVKSGVLDDIQGLPEVAVDTAEDAAETTEDVVDTAEDQVTDDTQQPADDDADETVSNDDEAATSGGPDQSEEQPVENSATEEDDAIPTTGVTVEELPNTGPTETLGTVAAFVLLAVTIVYYRRSVQAKA